MTTIKAEIALILLTWKIAYVILHKLIIYEIRYDYFIMWVESLSVNYLFIFKEFWLHNFHQAYLCFQNKEHIFTPPYISGLNLFTFCKCYPCLPATLSFIWTLLSMNCFAHIYFTQWNFNCTSDLSSIFLHCCNRYSSQYILKYEVIYNVKMLLIASYIKYDSTLC